MIHALAYTGVALVLLIPLGNWICRQIFNLTGLRDAIANEPEPNHVAGRVIGALERVILAVGIIAQSWEILAAVIALKTVARFQKMDNREFGEYFLVGSLFSIFWAMVVTSAWLAYDHRFGMDLRTQAVTLLGTEAKPDKG